MNVAVNVSALQFRDKSFLNNLFAIISESALDPRCLELELTESVLMKRPEATAPVLQTLRERGVRVTIDDFGTGYSSLSYLRRLPIDALKIDRSFVQQITPAGGDTSIAVAIISMARSLDLLVVAEGVKTQEEMAFLKANQCAEAQGFYFSPPVPPQEFENLLRMGITKPSVIAHEASR